MKWSVYNQSLVRRGEILLGFDVINNWDAELKEMNKDKVGLGTISLSKYLSPSLTWVCQGVISSTIQRQTEEGIAQGHAHGKVPSIPDYTTINRRINRLNIKIKEDNKDKEFEYEYIVIAIDKPGIKVTNRGLGG